MSRTDKDQPAQRRAGRRLFYSNPPRWFINEVWTARDRQAVRVECRNALKEHRARATVDTVPRVAQHRRCAIWQWR
jgi:hypothetical protein